MPLQIRRGSSVQRLAITPLDGELIWDQTEKRLYVGDGVEAGGTIATGYNNEDAILAIGSALDAGTHSGITFTYDNTSISATLSNVDAEVLSGTANISILSDDGSTLLLNSSTGVIQATSAFFNTIEGNLTGSVFASDSSIIVDSESYTVTASIGFFDQIHVAGNYLYFEQQTIDIKDPIDEDSKTIRFQKYSPDGRFTETIFANSQGFLSTGRHVMTYGGTPTSPTFVTVGDAIYTDVGSGYIGSGDKTESSEYVVATMVRSRIDPNGSSPTPTSSPGRLDLYTIDDGNLASAKGLSIDNRGYVSILKGDNIAEATLDINGFVKLAVLSQEPSNLYNGLVAIADGDSVSGWDPLGLGVPAKQQMVVYLGNGWRQIAVEP